MIKRDIEALELERKSLCDLQAEVNEQSDDFLEKGNSSNETEGKPTSIPKENVPSKNRRGGQNSLAIKTIGEHGITLVPEMGCFLVNGHCGKNTL